MERKHVAAVALAGAAVSGLTAFLYTRSLLGAGAFAVLQLIANIAINWAGRLSTCRNPRRATGTVTVVLTALFVGMAVFSDGRLLWYQVP